MCHRFQGVSSDQRASRQTTLNLSALLGLTASVTPPTAEPILGGHRRFVIKAPALGGARTSSA